MTRSKKKHKHLKIFTIKTILARAHNKNTIVLEHNKQKYRIKVHKSRFSLFKRNRVCSYCGRIGNIFVLDQQRKCNVSNIYKGNDVYEGIHLNLYCHNPEQGDFYILMTQDHIIPRKFGGLGSGANVQTLCCICNRKKGDIITNKDIVHLTSTQKGRKYIKRHYLKKGPDFLKQIQVI